MKLEEGQVYHIKSRDEKTIHGALVITVKGAVIFRYVNERGRLGARMVMDVREFQSRLVDGPFAPAPWWGKVD